VSSSSDESAFPSASGASQDGGYYGSRSADASAAAEDAGYKGNTDVQVVGQDVVGPYSSVIVRATKGAAIYNWLRANGFVVPTNIAPILAAYTKEGFDFLALRLRPDAGVRAMQPVRVVMPGAVTTLPLRMVAAGIGAKVGLTLFVVTEGRMRPTNFADVTVDNGGLAWNPYARSSNYRDAAETALATNGGRAWLTEFAGPVFGSSPGAIANINYDLAEFYQQSCIGLDPVKVACNVPITDVDDAGPAPDAGALPDGSDDAGTGMETDAGSDAEVQVPPPCTETKDACELFDDAKTALTGLHPSDVWVTRMRAELNADICASGDLSLGAQGSQGQVPAVIVAKSYTEKDYDPCPTYAPNNYSGSEGNYAMNEDVGTGSGGCACSTTSGPVPVAPVLGAIGVLMVLNSAQRRRRERR
jgi:hypothetical protein